MNLVLLIRQIALMQRYVCLRWSSNNHQIGLSTMQLMPLHFAIEKEIVQGITLGAVKA